ncbi:MAG: 2-C-methyl-D-erythritol 4-phosphate cytidylyltransferase [Acidobacteriota bacterium]
MIGLILAAAGAGSRFGSTVPKQFIPLDGVPVYLRSLEAFEPLVDHAVVVVPAGWIDRVACDMRERWPGRIRVEAGGEQRQDSVRRGLLALPPVEIVLVHDAARPYVSRTLIKRVLDESWRSGACIPGLPVSQTVKEVAGSTIVRTLDRRRLVLAQTPQGFRREILWRAFEAAEKDGFFGTDESILVERIGLPVSVVEGEPGNIKITFRQDMPGQL